MREKIEKLCRWTLLGMGLLTLFATLGHRALATLNIDPYTEAGTLHMMANGLRVFDLMTAPGVDNSLRVRNQFLANDPIIVSTNSLVLLGYSVGTTGGSPTSTAGVDIASQVELGLGTFTTAQVQAKTPARSGDLIWNTTLGLPCISTGTTVEGYSRLTGSTTCQ